MLEKGQTSSRIRCSVIIYYVLLQTGLHKPAGYPQILRAANSALMLRKSPTDAVVMPALLLMLEPFLSRLRLPNLSTFLRHSSLKAAILWDRTICRTFITPRRTLGPHFSVFLLFILLYVILIFVLTTSCSLLPRPETWEDDLLHARLDATLVKPSVNSAFDELCDLWDVL